MAEIINLRLARKAKKRAEETARTDASRLKHGAGKADRRLAADEATRLARTLDGARRDDG